MNHLLWRIWIFSLSQMQIFKSAWDFFNAVFVWWLSPSCQHLRDTVHLAQSCPGTAPNNGVFRENMQNWNGQSHLLKYTKLTHTMLKGLGREGGRGKLYIKISPNKRGFFIVLPSCLVFKCNKIKILGTKFHGHWKLQDRPERKPPLQINELQKWQ